MSPILLSAIVAGAVVIALAVVGLLMRNPKWTDEKVRDAVDRSVKEALEKAELKQKATDPLVLGAALERLYAAQVESFGKTAGVLGEFLQGAGELATHRYAIALGSRGGRKKQANIEARKAAPRRDDVYDQGCAACLDPMTKDSTAITNHVIQNHDKRRRQANAQAALPLAPQSTNGSAAAPAAAPATGQLN